PDGRKERARIEIGVAKEFETRAVKAVRPVLGDYGHDTARVVAIFGIETVGEHAEFVDRIQIRDDAGSAVHLFFHVGAVDENTVGVFALAAERLVAGVEVAGGRYGGGDAGHDDRIAGLGGHGHDAGLKREQVGEASAVEGNGGHHGAVHDIAHLRALRF